MELQKHIHSRYKQAMIPALIMGVLTNLYIIGVMFSVEGYDALFSPAIGTVIFLVCFFLLRADKIKAGLSFLIAGYTVAVEVSFLTYFLGWNSGFIYFMFLLPIVFLLNTSWKAWMTILFNGSIACVSLALFYLYFEGDAAHFVDPATLSFINLFNLGGTGLVVFVIMIYFSQTIN